MAKWKSTLNFPIFYCAVVKENSLLRQYDAVNALLTGNLLTGSDTSTFTISKNMASHYALGDKPLSTELATTYTELANNQRLQFIEKTRLHRTDIAAHTLYLILKNGHISMEPLSLNALLSFPYQERPSEFLCQALQIAVRCPREDVAKLSNEIKESIKEYRQIALGKISFSDENDHLTQSKTSIVPNALSSSNEERISERIQEKSQNVITPFYLNFQFFYNCVLRDNTPFDKATAVSLLLLKAPRGSVGNLKAISDVNVSSYIHGKRPLTRDLMSSVVQASYQELINRIRSLRLNCIYACVLTIRHFLNNGLLLVGASEAKTLRLIPDDEQHNMRFLAEALKCAASCRKNGTISVPSNAIEAILEYRDEMIRTHRPQPTPTTPFETLLPVSPRINNLHVAWNCSSLRVHKIELPNDRELLLLFLDNYGTKAQRNLNNLDTMKCLRYCEDYRNSYILDIWGDSYSIVDSLVHRISPNSCAHLTIMGEALDVKNLISLRNMICYLYAYSAGTSTPLYFAFDFNHNLKDNEYRLHIVYSELLSDEDSKRRSVISSERSADLSTNPAYKNLVPPFFLKYPEKDFNIEPLGPDYDPEMDQTEEAYDAILQYLKLR